MRLFLKGLIVFSTFIIGSTGSHASTDHSTAGTTFTDPDTLAKVEAGFQSKKITYDSKVGDVDLVITLGQQTYPALHKVIEKMAADKGIKIHIKKGSCGATARRLLKKSVDIGAYCCPPGKSDRLPGLEFHTIGITPLVLVTNTANPVENVSTDAAQRIFQGDYLNWTEVPGTESLADKLKGKSIQPVARLHCKKRPGHWRGLIINADEFSPKVKEVGVIPDLVKQVAQSETAIGFETAYMLKVHKDKGELKILNIDGRDPDNLEHLLNGDYPLYRVYNLTTWTNPESKNKFAEDFVKDIADYIEADGDEFRFIPSSKLRKAGWKFRKDELIGQPDGMPVLSERK